jgi:GH35 family endo-1,4-beta-xylanase
LPFSQDLAAVIKSFIDLGLRVFISELDIVNPDGQDAQQADDYAFAFDACLKNYPGCMGVNMWGLNDRVNWNGESSKATMFDGDCNIKEGIAEGVKAVLNGTETF